MNNTITKDLLQNLRVDMAAALKSVEAKYGLRIMQGSCRFTADNAVFKMEAARIVKEGNSEIVVSKEVTQLKSYAKLYGITDDMLAKGLRLGGKQFWITGYCSRKSKAPFILRDEAGKSFLGRTTMVLPALGLKSY